MSLHGAPVDNPTRRYARVMAVALVATVTFMVVLAASMGAVLHQVRSRRPQPQPGITVGSTTTTVVVPILRVPTPVVTLSPVPTPVVRTVPGPVRTVATPVPTRVLVPTPTPTCVSPLGLFCP